VLERSPTKQPMTPIPLQSNQCTACLQTNYGHFIHDGPPLWSSGHSSWLQIQRSGFDYRCYEIFREVVGLVRGPLSLVITTEGLLERKSSGSGLETRECGSRDPSRWPRGTLSPQKLALTWRQAAVTRSGSFARGLRTRSVSVYLLMM
jgi:hypothetical protein